MRKQHGESQDALDDDSISSESESDEDNEEETEDFHEEMGPALLIGQTYTAYWPWTAFLDNAVNEDNITYDSHDEGSNERENLHATWNGCYLEPYNSHRLFHHEDLPSPSPFHRRAPSLPSELQLDEITVTSDQEYGFNPNRRRPVSLYHSEDKRFCFSESRGSIASILGKKCVNEAFSRSHATNEKEAILEAEVKHLRSQPSGVQFMRRCTTDINAIKQHAEAHRDGKLGRKRLRALKRQLSFDSKARRKTVSDDRDIAKLRGKGNRHSKAGTAVPYLRSRSRDESDCRVAERFQDLSSLSAEVLCSSSVNISSAEQEGSPGNVQVINPPILSEKLETDIFLRGDNDHAKGLDHKARRRGTIPAFFGGLRFPNKKAFKKLMKRRQGDRAHVPSPVVPLSSSVSHANREDCDPDSLIQRTSPEVLCSDRVQSLTGDLSTSQHSINSFRRQEKQRVHKKGHPMRLLVSCAGIPLTKEPKSCSVRSLPKVEEGFEEEVETSKSLGSLDGDNQRTAVVRRKKGKDTLDFDESFRQKSCSTCSIAVARHLRGSGSRDDVQVLRRRMSDTALALKDRTPGCSPGKRFVKKFLSPVVCGLPVDRYISFNNDSLLSLASDNTSLASECELQQAQLFSFSLQEVAEELTLVDKELLIRISWQELANCSWMSKNKFSIAPNVMNMVDFFNRIAMLIATNILAEETAIMRAKIISKVIKLARKCRLMNNFNSLKAILGGLQCTPIYRLKATWKVVSSRRKKQLKELTNLMSELDNFKKYREEFNRCLSEDMSCLPFLGDFLTQLAQTHAYFAVRRKLLNSHRTSIPRSDSPLPSQSDAQAKVDNFQIDELDDSDDKGSESREMKRHSSSVCVPNDDATPSDQTSVVKKEDQIGNGNASPIKPDFLQVRQIPLSKQSKRTHARSDSDDSGVVIDSNRLSRSSEDLDGSRENINRSTTSDYERCSDGTSSPDGEGRDMDLFIVNEESGNNSVFMSEEEKHKNHNEECSRTDPKNDTSSEDRSDNVKRKNGNVQGKLDEQDGSCENEEMIGSEVTQLGTNKIERWHDCATEEFAKETRELEDNLRKKRLPPKDDKYQKELDFWRYQIVAIQYRFPPRPHVRRFLLNTVYRSEEENYRLSLTREPPQKVN